MVIKIMTAQKASSLRAKKNAKNYFRKNSKVRKVRGLKHFKVQEKLYLALILAQMIKLYELC